MSARWSTCGSADACSGAMYAGVPSATPIVVIVLRPVASLTARATPKSVTSACRPESITLSGLMSRCTTPCACASASASASSTRILTASPTPPPRECVAAREPLPQRLTLHVRHHIVEQAAGLSRVEQRQDVRMLELGGDLDLTQEPRAADRRAEILLQHLDRDLTVVLEVLGEVHGRHPSRAELALHAISLGEGGGDAGDRLGHSRSGLMGTRKRVPARDASQCARARDLWPGTRQVATLARPFGAASVGLATRAQPEAR